MLHNFRDRASVTWPKISRKILRLNEDLILLGGNTSTKDIRLSSRLTLDALSLHSRGPDATVALRSRLRDFSSSFPINP